MKTRRVAAYVAQDGELDPAPLVNRLLAAGKQVALPVIVGVRRLAFYRYHIDTPLVGNRYGIPEPDPIRTPAISTFSLDLVLVPLVGFDADGNRLGMGGGFYDTAFAHHQRSQTAGPCLLGFAHAQQQIDQLTSAAWDAPLDAVLTEDGIMAFTPRGAGLLARRH